MARRTTAPTGPKTLPTPDPVPPVTPDAPEDDSIPALFGRLVDTGERFVRAELKLYRATLLARLRDARLAVIGLLVAFLIVQSSIIALLVGLIVILRRPLGAVGATAAVVGGAVLLAIILSRLAFERLRQVTEIKDRK